MEKDLEDELIRSLFLLKNTLILDNSSFHAEGFHYIIICAYCKSFSLSSSSDLAVRKRMGTTSLFCLIFLATLNPSR